MGGGGEACGHCAGVMLAPEGFVQQVMMMAITPSLNASSRPLPMRAPLFRPDARSFHRPLELAQLALVKLRHFGN